MDVAKFAEQESWQQARGRKRDSRVLPKGCSWMLWSYHLAGWSCSRSWVGAAVGAFNAVRFIPCWQFG